MSIMDLGISVSLLYVMLAKMFTHTTEIFYIHYPSFNTADSLIIYYAVSFVVYTKTFLT